MKSNICSPALVCGIVLPVAMKTNFLSAPNRKLSQDAKFVSISNVGYKEGAVHCG